MKVDPGLEKRCQVFLTRFGFESPREVRAAYYQALAKFYESRNLTKKE